MLISSMAYISILDISNNKRPVSNNWPFSNLHKLIINKYCTSYKYFIMYIQISPKPINKIGINKKGFKNMKPFYIN